MSDEMSNEAVWQTLADADPTIRELLTPQYPAWQQHLRVAQEAVRLSREQADQEAEIERKKEEQAKQAELGRQLAQALSLLGLPLTGEPPATNKVVLDGDYQISLQTRLAESKWKDGNQHTTFQLRVTKQALSGDYEEDERWVVYQPSFNLIDGKATDGDLAEFAAAIDHVDTGVRIMQEQAEERKRRLQTEEQERSEREQRPADSVRNDCNPPATTTLDEQLVDLLRKLVREELEARLNW